MTDRRNRILAILNYLEKNLYSSSTSVSGIEIATATYSIPEIFPTDEVSWRHFATDETWGGMDSHFLFRASVKGEKDKPVAVLLQTDSRVRWSTDNPQILVYLNGSLRGTMDMNHQLIVLSEKCEGDEIFSLGFYAYANSRGRTNFFNLHRVVPSWNVMSLYFDMKNIFEAAVLLPSDDLERIKAFAALEKAIDVLDTRSSDLLAGSADSSRKILGNYLESRAESSVVVSSVGSTHIDVAWKWPLRQTRQKAVRSALTALNLMDHYPAFSFLLTQPQVYEFIREERPDVFNRIKERIKEGRWEAEGGMWLESDCNLASGESLVRQLIHGKRYIENVLGAPESKILWLPDAFGFNGNLPQIMKKAGIEYFMTTKISWSDTHIFPYDIFSWRGIDGSEVLSYFISTRDYGSDGRHTDYHTTYNGVQNASQIMGTWSRFQDKDILENVLTCYGYGDGGGGPTFEMLENSKRLSHSIARCPKTVHTSARAYFESLKENIKKPLPRWTGELYFEYHRGVMTSISEEKKWNRKIENLTHDAEFLSVLAHKSFAREFDSIWKTILLNQFHDILPGSAIDEVYDEAFREYGEAAEKDKAIIEESLSALFGDKGSALLAVNTTGHERTSLLVLNDCPEGVYSEKTFNGKYLVLAENVPAYGARTISSMNIPSLSVADGNPEDFETPFYKVMIDPNGCISSLFDKESNREVIKTGEAGNKIISYEDRPLRFDNWNTEEYYREKPYPWKRSGNIRFVENGKLRAVLEVNYESLSSKMTEHIVFYRHTKRIDFISSLDWDGDHLLVKAEFPVSVLSHSADYEIQFGSITRSTTTNTDWDRAAFEVPALRWSDISEPGFGVSLITDSRYGYSVRDGVMTVSLLKSGTEPAENADRGHHEFTYSVYPHEGTWRDGGTVLEAEDLNKPLIAFHSDCEVSMSFACSSKNNVVIDTIKEAEDGKGIVIRAYEAYGMRTEAELKFAESYRIHETDLLERKISEEIEGSSVKRTFMPYEIVTFYLQR